MSALAIDYRLNGVILKMHGCHRFMLLLLRYLLLIIIQSYSYETITVVPNNYLSLGFRLH